MNRNTRFFSWAPNMNDFDGVLKRDSAPDCKELTFIPQDIEKSRLTFWAHALI